ncbi:hypothetical protein ILYODFUR_030617 [Ilyodon furcidens]|uniref:Uncharacterized protein n=1 Tax=Ilyodon furcidens TaxID=33524 RepID=A0ABV0TPA0_9TELE
MDGVKYGPILEENLLEAAEDWRLGWRFTFQQDNHPKHPQQLNSSMPSNMPNDRAPEPNAAPIPGLSWVSFGVLLGLPRLKLSEQVAWRSNPLLGLSPYQLLWIADAHPVGLGRF